MKTKKEMRVHRKRRIRAKVNGTADRPRMAVYRSHKTIYVQLVDDVKGKTLFGLSCKGTTIAKAKELGVTVAAVAKKKRITKAVFDRGGYKYHGVIKSLADAAREGGLTI